MQSFSSTEEFLISTFNKSFNCPDSLLSQCRVSQVICPVLNWNGVGVGGGESVGVALNGSDLIGRFCHFFFYCGVL